MKTTTRHPWGVLLAIWGLAGCGFTEPPQGPEEQAGAAGVSSGTGGGAGGSSPAGTGGGGNQAGSGGQAMAVDDGGSLRPMLLSETGLYTNPATGELATDVHAFQPQFALWSDGATKKRWIKLPAGAKIDTSEMDFWVYPPGTKLFKEFSRDGVRVETRMLWKIPSGDWFMMAYKWNAAQSDAVATPNGEANASGTQHDIPSETNCATCHGAMKDKVLGFNAIQLSHNLPGSLNMDQVVTNGWISNPPATKLVIPGNDIAKAALGYLHANCGICHNERAKPGIILGVDMWLDTAPEKLTSVQETPIYTTLVNQNSKSGITMGSKRIAPGNPNGSAVLELMGRRDGSLGDEGGTVSQMPPLATELVDAMGTGAIRAWINDLGAQ